MRTKTDNMKKQKQAIIRNINNLRSAYAISRGAENEVEQSVEVGQRVSREMANLTEVVVELANREQSLPVKWRNLGWALTMTDWWRGIEDQVFLQGCGVSLPND